jgi:hypothetical protein
MSLIGMDVVEWIAGDSVPGSPITLRGKGEGSSFSGIRNDVIDSSRYDLASLTMSFQSLCALFRDFGGIIATVEPDTGDLSNQGY